VQLVSKAGRKRCIPPVFEDDRQLREDVVHSGAGFMRLSMRDDVDEAAKAHEGVGDRLVHELIWRRFRMMCTTERQALRST
jgi:hypothetical protein